MISSSGSIVVSPDIVFQCAPVEQNVFLLAVAPEGSLCLYLSGPDTVFPVPLSEMAVEVCPAAPDAAVPAVLFEIDRPFFPEIRHAGFPDNFPAA